MQSVQDQVALINQYRQTNPALAYAIYNGFSGMGGQPSSGGALTVALRDAWGPEAAQQFVNEGTNKYGNTMFDPTTGQWAGMGEANGQGGMVAGYDPNGYNPNAGNSWISSNPTLSYDPTAYAGNQPGPTGQGLNAALGITTNPNGTYSQYQAPATTGASSRGGGLVTGGVPGRNGTRSPAGGTSLAALSNPGAGGTGSTGGGYPAVGSSSGIGGGVPAVGSHLGGSLPGGTNGASGAELPTANAAPYDPYQAGAYSAPTRPGSSSTPFDFLNDAGVKYRIKQGTDAVENSAAARGGLLSGATIKGVQDRGDQIATEEYDKAYGRYNTDRNFNEGQYLNDRNFGRNTYTDDRNFGNSNSIDARNYNNQNREWDTSFNNNNRIDARNFDQNSSIDSRNYLTGLDQWNANFGQNAAMDARDYQTRLDQYNQQFGYNAATGDRAFNASTLKDLASMGLGATGSSGGLAAQLAAMLGNNTMTGAGAGAAGTVGGANNINNLVSQIMQYLQGQSLVNAVKP